MIEEPLRRRHADPIAELPRPRNSIRDRHHLIWPRLHIHSLGIPELMALRSSGCAIAGRLDSMVHTITHQRFDGIVQVTQGHERTDLRRRAADCIMHHENRICGCFQRRHLRTIDALTLEPLGPNQIDRPPCATISVDSAIAELMRDYYATAAPVTDQLRLELERRCDERLCTCGPVVSQAPRLTSLRPAA